MPAEGSKLGLTANLLFVVAALFLAIGVLSLLRDRATRDWPTVEGRVERSAVKRDDVRRTNTGGQIETRTRYSADLVYAYEVDGTAFRGTRVTALDLHHSAPDAAEAVVARYPAGSPVQVHYDADDPAQAVLEVQTSVGGYAPLGFAAFWVVAGLALRLAARLRPG